MEDKEDLSFKRVLGIDASTTTIGLSLLRYNDSDIQLEHCEYYKPPKKGGIFERLYFVREFISKKIDELKPDFIALEDIVLFMAGNSTARTISSLAVLNRTVGLAVYEKTGEEPVLFNVTKIRHSIKKEKKMPKKEEIPEVVASILNVDFPYVFNKKGNPRKENFDVADSIACALCYINNERKNE
jgi:Holliday junction resolvasome RuvABC endonuclease subunit